MWSPKTRFHAPWISNLNMTKTWSEKLPRYCGLHSKPKNTRMILENRTFNCFGEDNIMMRVLGRSKFCCLCLPNEAYFIVILKRHATYLHVYIDFVWQIKTRKKLKHSLFPRFALPKKPTIKSKTVLSVLALTQHSR